MPARTPSSAVEAFLAPLNQVVSCITRTPLIGSGYRPAAHAHSASFAPLLAPIRLRGRHSLRLSIAHYYSLNTVEEERDRRDVATVGYAYEILDAQGRDILAFHWHPVGHSRVTFPHMHLGPRTEAIDLTKAHIPTGVVPLEAIIWFAISEMGVEPLRSDWVDIVRKSGAFAAPFGS